ncbi:hypothetical protein LMJ30_00970 [Massilia sp. MAHUQ-52]|uniref:Uncharacterized protein n=1 Tax=Massilia agrisoli TaxID=2892444 RepID=A0ABS8IMJ5_9BURK|nr:hypothetical protein [Massilia agrisoli]MCC6069531.1 hypothetical protein [Massilia agrisoli]
MEAGLVRQAVGHEQRQHVVGVERDVIVPVRSAGQAALGQRFFQLVEVLARGDDDALVAGGQGRTDEIGQPVDEESVVFVKLDQVCLRPVTVHCLHLLW